MPHVVWRLFATPIGMLHGYPLVLVVQRERRSDLCAEGVVLAGTWFALLFVSLVRYMTTTPSAEGRLLIPGIASL